MSKTGSCLCGAVRFTLQDKPEAAGACHCGMCRKFSGGVLIAVEVAPEAIRFEGGDNIRHYTSSDWAERGFCGTCGSSLYYRVTADGPHQGRYYLCLGALDDPSGIPLEEEIFIDRKPDGYRFDGDTRKLTEAEMMAQFAEMGG